MKRKIVAILSVDDETAFREISDGPIAYLEKEMGWLKQSSISLESAFIKDDDDESRWQRYINYLVGWDFRHIGQEYTGMNHASFEEFKEIECCSGIDLGSRSNFPTEDDLKEIAREIVEELADSSFDDCTDSSGYYTIKCFEEEKDGEGRYGDSRAIDVYKSTGVGKEPPHYTVYCSFEDETSDYKYSKDLSAESLLEVIKEFTNID